MDENSSVSPAQTRITNKKSQTTRKAPKKLDWSWILVAILGLALLASFTGWKPLSQNVQPVIPTVVPTSVVVDAPAQENQIPFAQAPTCIKINAPEDASQYVEFELHPNTTVTGDFEAMVNNEWIKMHDDGIGQYEIFRNVSAELIQMRGHWGGGCLLSVDEKILVNGEFENPNHTDLVRVHLVTFTAENEYTEKYYSKSELPIK